MAIGWVWLLPLEIKSTCNQYSTETNKSDWQGDYHGD